MTEEKKNEEEIEMRRRKMRKNRGKIHAANGVYDKASFPYRNRNRSSYFEVNI